jgi:hypothetical protein
MMWEVSDVRHFCGVDRLQITCLRRSGSPSAVTAKTPKFGLEINLQKFFAKELGLPDAITVTITAGS